MKKNNKPSSYDFFKKGDKKPSLKDMSFKDKMKKTWKWSRIFIYIFLFATVLTGCVQSFALPNSTTVGSGIEFVNNKNELSPKSTVFEEKKNDKGQVIGFTPQREQRNVITGRDDEEKEVIKNMISITELNGGEYGKYNTFSSLIYILNSQNKREYNIIDPTDPKKLLYYHSTFTRYNRQLEWTDIPLLTIKLTHETDETKKAFENSVKKVAGGEVVFPPSVNNLATFSRDVLQTLYNQTINLEIYKDNKLTNALEDVNLKGNLASAANIDLVNSYMEAMGPILASTEFTIAKADGTYDYNYLKTHPIPFSSNIASKPLITWGSAWELGPFFGIVVWPLAKVMTSIVYAMPFLSGWESIIAIIVAIVLTRVITLIFSFKSLFMQSKQEELQVKKAKIDAKYAAYKGNKEMEQRQRQEVAAMYKSNNFSQASMFTQILISMPIFIAMWRIIQSIPIIEATSWLGINFSLLSWQEVFYQKQWIYLVPIVVAIIVQLVAQLLPRILNKRNKKTRIMNENEIAAMKKQQKTQNIMTIFFIFFYVLWQAGIQIYSIFGGLWTIAQITILHFYKKSKHFRTKLKPWLFKENKK